MTKPVAPVLVIAMLAVLTLGLLPDRTAHAAGRTYVPQYIKEDKKKRNRRTEACRLVRLDRNEEDTSQRLWKQPLRLALPEAVQAEHGRITRVALGKVCQLTSTLQLQDILADLLLASQVCRVEARQRRRRRDGLREGAQGLVWPIGCDLRHEWSLQRGTGSVQYDRTIL